ncbi:MAG: acyltransferase [Eubacterium sp.]|nr:acyltransferase [Eubacterium sp.]
MNETRQTSKHRYTELDILRIIALLAVISVHVPQDELFSLGNWHWTYYTICGAAVTWQVPIFVMISGRFFLDPMKNITISGLLKKNISRLVIAFLFWDVIYQTFYILNGTYASLNAKGILMEAIQGPYHFWFLFMLVCLYMITPFLRKFTDDKQLMQIFILLFFLFQAWSGYGEMLPSIGSTVSALYVKTNFHFALGYSGYFVLGYYLYKYPLAKKQEFLLYALGILSFAATISIVVLKQDASYSKYLMPNVILEASALYTFFVNRMSKIEYKEKLRTFFAKLAEYSFGIYLIHPLVIDVLGLFGIDSETITPMVMVPLLIIGCFMVSYMIVGLIKKIPVPDNKLLL